MSVARLHPDPHLTITCKPVTRFGDDIRAVADDLARAMYDSFGRGFAAPQHANAELDVRIFVMDAQWKESGENFPCVVVNPQIISSSPDVATHTESCLSIPDTPRAIARPAWIDAQWNDVDGQQKSARFDGIEAAIFQHELDHLNGVLILDHPEAPAE